jgi:hypothetical protein
MDEVMSAVLVPISSGPAVEIEGVMDRARFGLLCDEMLAKDFVRGSSACDDCGDGRRLSRTVASNRKV